MLHIVSRCLRGKARAQYTLTGQVEVARVLEHRPGHHVPHAQAMQVETLDQAFQRRGQHFLIAHMRIRTVGTGEGDAVAADDSDPAH
ncbi:hypothetical protein D3C85_1212270 [compost metagenome]